MNAIKELEREQLRTDVPEIAAAACIWRDLAPSPEAIMVGGLEFGGRPLCLLYLLRRLALAGLELPVLPDADAERPRRYVSFEGNDVGQVFACSNVIS